MFIQKIFHIHHNVAETKARLAKVAHLTRYLGGVKKAVLTADGVGQFACELPKGLQAHCVVVGLPTDDENQVLFQSTTGNLNVAGLIEYVPVKENLTEVQLTLEYSFTSPLSGLLDRMGHCMERFLQRQLAAIRIGVEGSYAFAPQGSASMSRPEWAN